MPVVIMPLEWVRKEAKRCATWYRLQKGWPEVVLMRAPSRYATYAMSGFWK